ncbi:MAG: hypothetical protein Q8L35_02165 [Actinomycetota bacterium]|nr:hypothetical protein [Actinomycetota bacterium]
MVKQLMLPVVDLKAQYLEIKDELTAVVNQVLADGRFILGPNVAALEDEIAAFCGARIGGASLLLPGITIGREAFVAAGSVVTKDVPDAKLVMGIPARIIRDVPQDEWLSD